MQSVVQNAMKMTNDILKFQQECFKHYLNDIREKITEFPEKYLFPDGNPILPVLPVRTGKENLMFVGAFPSARFENRNGLLIPTANNLSPFGKEEYFDGQQIRKQTSREVLEKEFFSKLNINADEHWLTDLVKVYLMPEKHIKNCIQINPNLKYINTHKLFKRIAIASKKWFYKEVGTCKPKLIITFGEVVARVIQSDFKTNNQELLSGQISQVRILDSDYNICHLPHPEIVRRNKEWQNNNSIIMSQLSQEIKKFLNKK